MVRMDPKRRLISTHIQPATWEGRCCTSSETAAEVEFHPADEQRAPACCKNHSLQVPRSIWVGKFYPIFLIARTWPLPTIICSGLSTTRLEDSSSIPTAHLKPGWQTSSRWNQKCSTSVASVSYPWNGQTWYHGDYNKWKSCSEVNKFLHLKKRKDLIANPILETGWVHAKWGCPHPETFRDRSYSMYWGIPRFPLV